MGVPLLINLRATLLPSPDSDVFEGVVFATSAIDLRLTLRRCSRICSVVLSLESSFSLALAESPAPLRLTAVVNGRGRSIDCVCAAIASRSNL